VRVTLFAFLLLTLTACGGGNPSPESVARAWSQSVNSDDDAGAARLFAIGARVVQGDGVRRFETFAEARAWHRALPCAGRIVALRARGETVRVTFVLSDRRQAECDAPGERAHALFRVRNGKIVLWHQLEGPEDPNEEPV
jgi:limonene-1,2-epoxide hydrolase